MTDRKPRLTYLITGLQFGGANIGMVRLLSELSPAEFDVTVVSIAETSPDVVSMLPDHVTLERFDVSKKYALYELRPLVRILRKTDILVCSLFHATVVGAVLGYLCRVPTILVWRHNTAHPNRIRPLVYRVVYRVVDRLLADSEAAKRLLVDEFGVENERISVLPIAQIDIEESTPASTNEYNSRPVVRVATVDQPTEHEGYDKLLASSQRLGSDFNSHIAESGSEREKLEQSAPENGTFDQYLTETFADSFRETIQVATETRTKVTGLGI